MERYHRYKVMTIACMQSAAGARFRCVELWKVIVQAPFGSRRNLIYVQVCQQVTHVTSVPEKKGMPNHGAVPTMTFASKLYSFPYRRQFICVSQSTHDLHLQDEQSLHLGGGGYVIPGGEV